MCCINTQPKPKGKKKRCKKLNINSSNSTTQAIQNTINKQTERNGKQTTPRGKRTDKVTKHKKGKIKQKLCNRKKNFVQG